MTAWSKEKRQAWLDYREKHGLQTPPPAVIEENRERAFAAFEAKKARQRAKERRAEIRAFHWRTNGISSIGIPSVSTRAICEAIEEAGGHPPHELVGR